VESQQGNIRAEVDQAFRQLLSQSATGEFSVQVIDVEKEALEERARELDRREIEVERRENEASESGKLEGLGEMLGEEAEEDMPALKLQPSNPVVTHELQAQLSHRLDELFKVKETNIRLEHQIQVLANNLVAAKSEAFTHQ
jgi:hypothetical protein